MKKILFLSLSGLILTTVTNNLCAKTIIPDITTPSVVEFQLQKEQWVKTNTALVTISADVTLDKANSFVQTREQLLAKFATLAENITWNITTFNTSQSESGLEQMHVEAQARLAENTLGNLREKTKELSKPGLTLRLVSIDFSPSAEELETAKANLRSIIYNEAKQEITRINKIYPEQNYILHSITFQPTAPAPMPLALNVMASRVADGTFGGANKNAATDTAVLAVSTKMQLTATVDLSSSTPKETMTK